jgi:beta-glucanase (GH16 family)
MKQSSSRSAHRIGIVLAHMGVGALSLSCTQEGSIGPKLGGGHDIAAEIHDAGPIGTGPSSGGTDAAPAVHDAAPAGNDTAPASHDAGATASDAAPDSGVGQAVDARDAGTTVPTDAGGGYVLVFSDEFNGTSLDRSKWCTRFVYGGGPTLQVPDSACTGPGGTAGTLDFLNDEQQRYVDTNTKGEAMHVEAGGTLTMRSTKTRTDTYASYESAMLRSKMEFKPSTTTSYYIVARLRLPNVKGTWPAMWLSGGFGTTGQTQWPPEIDIFEGALNEVEDTINMMRMGSQVKGGMQTNSGAQEITYSASYDRTWDNYIATDTLRGVWLNIGSLWTADSVCYLVNGVKTMCENYRWTDDSGTPANPASLLVNLAIGGAWAGRHGIEDTAFPAALEADYVHVYSFAGSTPPATLPP